MCGDALKILFTSQVFPDIIKITVCYTSFAGQLSADDRNRYDALGIGSKACIDYRWV